MLQNNRMGPRMLHVALDKLLSASEPQLSQW